MAEYKINESGEIIFNNTTGNRHVLESDPWWKEYIQLEYEVLNNQHNPTKDPVKIARYNELKKQLNIEDLNRAKERIQQKIIACDESTDNSVVYAAITNFKKTNE